MVVVKPAWRMCAIQASQQAQVGVLKTVRFLDGRVWAQADPPMPMKTAAPMSRRRFRLAGFKRVLPDRCGRIAAPRQGRRAAAPAAPATTVGQAARQILSDLPAEVSEYPLDLVGDVLE